MIINLSEFDLLAIEGVDAAKFLQGQLTCNVEAATPTHSIQGAYCNLSGRVIADMRLLPFEGGLYLLCQAGMAEILKTALDKYIVFSKAKTNIVTEQYCRFGFIGQDLGGVFAQLGIAEPPQQGGLLSIPEGFIYRLEAAQPRYELLIKQEQSPLLDTLKNMPMEADRSAWDLAQIRSGVVHVDPALQSEHTPQVLNYDLLGLVDFKKGCYTGQEIIARMHYRGKAKKRLYLAQATDFTISPTTQLQIAEDKTAPIIRFANDQNGHGFLLAILPCDAVEQEQAITLVDTAGQRQAVSIMPLPEQQ